MVHSAPPRNEPGATTATPASSAAFAPPTNTRGEQLWTMVDLRDAIDRFEAMLRAGGKRHATIAAYVTQSERFLNWLEGVYQPRTKRLNGPGNHVQANAWLTAKRKVVQLDLVECRVVFIKAERNLAPNAARLFG